MATEYLEKRQLRDLTALQKKLSLQLEKDIQILHSRSEFYDLLLHWDHENIQLKVHQCILKARTPAFLKQLLCLSSQPGDLCIDLSNYNSEKVTSLVEKIYSNSEVRKLESEVVQHLKDKVTEKFYTPASTPLDCVTQALYYSLVTVDSDYSSHGTVDNVDKELEEQDLLSRSFELIKNKKSQARRSSSGNVRKIPRVKMSKIADESTKIRQTPVYTSSNGGGISISSREHTTSDTSGVDVNESSTSSLTEPEIWDSTEHEDNDDEFDFFDDKTLHANDPPLGDKSPLIFSPDTLKPAPGSHYFPPSDLSDQGNEPASLASNSSSNFFIDASSLLDENEFLIAKKDEGVSNGGNVPYQGSPKIEHHDETSVKHCDVSPINIKDSSVTMSQNGSTKQSNVVPKEIILPTTQSSTTNGTSSQKHTNFERLSSVESTDYETFIINSDNSKDLSSHDYNNTANFSSNQSISSPSPSKTFVKDTCPKEKVSPATNNGVDTTNIHGLIVESKNDELNAISTASIIVNNENDNPPFIKGLTVTSHSNDTNHQPFNSAHKINDDVSPENEKDSFNVIDNFSKSIIDRADGDNHEHIQSTSIKNQVNDKIFVANLPNDTNILLPITNGLRGNSAHKTSENEYQTFVISEMPPSTRSPILLHQEEPKTFIVKSDTKEQEKRKTFIIESEITIQEDDKTFIIQSDTIHTTEPKTFLMESDTKHQSEPKTFILESDSKYSGEPKTFVIESDTFHKNEPETSNVLSIIDHLEEPKTFLVESDKNRIFDLVSEICVNKQKTSSRETLDLINEAVDITPSPQDPFETHHIIESCEKRKQFVSNKTFDLIESSILPSKLSFDDIGDFKIDVNHKMQNFQGNTDVFEKEIVKTKTATNLTLSAAKSSTSPSNINVSSCNQTFSFDKTDENTANIAPNEENLVDILAKSKNQNNEINEVVQTVCSSIVTKPTHEQFHTNPSLTNSKHGNTTNPFLNMNPFIDYSEENSIISADSIDIQHTQNQGYSNIHDNAINLNASVTKVNTSFSSNPNVNKINTSFSSTNPFLNDIQNDAMNTIAKSNDTFLVNASQPTTTSTFNISSHPAGGMLTEKDSGVAEHEKDQLNHLETEQKSLDSIDVLENEVNILLNSQKESNPDSQVVYRRDVKKYDETTPAELYIQHSTPLSASVDNLLEMNCTPIKPEKDVTFNLNATQIKRLSCKLNDENLSKANEQLNLLLSGDSFSSSNPCGDANFTDSQPNETNSKTLCPSKTQGVTQLDLILPQVKMREDFHSPDSLNTDDAIKYTHHIDEDNRSKNSSDIDCLPILSGGVSLKDLDVAPASPRRSLEKSSTSWTVPFAGERMTRSVNHPAAGTVPDHPAAGTLPDTLSKSSTTLVKHGDSFSHNNKSCGFYIDLNEPCPARNDGEKRTKSAGDNEKKMFNMFIDISNSDSSDKEKSTKSPRPLLRKKMKPLSVTDRFLARQCSEEGARSSAEESDGEHPEVVKGKTLFRNVMTPPPSTQTSTTDQSMTDLTESGGSKKQNGGSGFFMFIGADPTPVVKRRLSSGGIVAARNNPNRHSWNSDSSGPAVAPPPSARSHRRAASISCKLSDLDTSPSVPPSGDKLASSWHAASKTGGMDISDCSVTRSDTTSGSVKSNATYNVETGDHGTEEVGFKSIPEDAAVDSTNDTSRNDTYVIEGKDKCNGTLLLETPTVVEDRSEHINKDQDGTEASKPLSRGPPKLVKLSDMDRAPPPPSSSASPLPAAPPSRLSRSQEGGAGRELVQASRSLTRLFPHVLIGSLSSSQEDGHTTISTVSSLQSSNNRSTLDVSTDEGQVSSGDAKASSALGADLLRMFLEEISADVTVEVAGRRIRAHKCVLSSRCQYFAAVLSGGWVESAGNVISLQGYSFSSVHFALCHIYSGAGDMPENINVVELATLADMLCLEGLKEVISGVLKHKYCHYFHKPCNTCILGVIEVLPLAAAYGLDDIYRKSLRWIAKYFVRVWPTKAFGSMPKELIDKCLKQILVHMTSDNVLDTLMSVEKVRALLPPGLKWTEPITHSLNKLQEACAKYIAQHLSSVLTSDALLALSRDELWDIGILESVLLGAGTKLSPDEACRSIVQLDQMLNHTPEPAWHESFGHALSQLGSSVKSCLVRQASKACRSPAWQLIPPTLRRDIQESAGLILVPGDEKRRARMMRKSTEARKNPTDAARKNPTDARKNPAAERDLSSGGTPAMRRSTGGEGSYATSRSLEHQVRQSMSQQATRKTPVPDLIPRAKPKFSEVKSRYLESRPSRSSDPAPSDRKSASTSSSSSVTHARLGSHGNRATGISSSESSRQSSPAMSKRNLGQAKDKSTSRLSLDSKLEAETPRPQQKTQDMKLIRETLTLNIRKSHEADDVTSQALVPGRNIKDARIEKTLVRKIPSVAMATRLPVRNNENRPNVLTKSLTTTESSGKKTTDTKLTRNSRLSFDNVRKPAEGGSAKLGSRLSLESKSLRSSPLDNRTRETLRASTDRLSVDTLSSRNKRRTGSSSSLTSTSSAKASSLTPLSSTPTPNMNKKPLNINRSPIKMNKTALLRSSAGLSLRNGNTPAPPSKTRLHGNDLHGNDLHGNQKEEEKKLGTRSGTFCLDESASILKNINTVS